MPMLEWNFEYVLYKYLNIHVIVTLDRDVHTCCHGNRVIILCSSLD